MKLEDCISPLKYEDVRVGKARLHKQSSGSVVLTYNNEIFMGYDVNNHWQSAEFIVEYNLAYGRCITTGMGLGIIQSTLLKNPKVTEIIVYEKNQDVIDLFKIIAKNNNLDISKIKIICQDADQMKEEIADCIFIDHYDAHEIIEVQNRVRNIAKNNSANIVWYWPAVKHYSLWCRKHLNLPIGPESYASWVKSIEVKNFPNQLSEEDFENIRDLEHKYAKDSVKHIMEEYRSYEERDMLRSKMIGRFNKKI